MRQYKSNRKIILFLFVVSLIVISISACLGKYPIDAKDFFLSIWAKIFPIEHAWPSQVDTILFKVRFPRIIMAVLIGAGLSAAGATYQSLFQNPMISQDVLGASQGAAFGAAIGIFFQRSYNEIVLFAFLMGLFAVGLVIILSHLLKTPNILSLVLIGMMISSLFSSAISYLKLVGDPLNTLPSITYWLMGSLSSIKPKDVLFCVPFIIIGLLPLYFLRYQLNVLSLGDEEAKSIGQNVILMRLIFIFASTLITAAAVSVSGLIGWVGLIIPHFARMLVGSDHRYMIPCSMVVGGTFLVIVDDFARLLTTTEIPIGILTAFIGAPIFLVLIYRANRSYQ